MRGLTLNVTDVIVVGHFDDGRSFIRKTPLEAVLRPGDTINLNYKLDYKIDDDDASHQQQDQFSAYS